MNKKLLLPIALAAAVSSGCTNTRVSRIETGMFRDKPELLLDAYENLRQRTEKETLTRKEVEAMGFDLKAPNVEDIPGPLALKRIFGNAVFEKKMGDTSPERLLKKFEDYRGFSIPYRHLVRVSDRIYFSLQESRLSGDDIRILILFNGDKLCYHELECVKIDIYRSRYAFAEMLIELLKGPGRAAFEILESLHQFQNPGLEFFAPIPLLP